MADSFADLWSSTAPTNPSQQQPRKLGDHRFTPPIQPRKPQNDIFSLLAAPTSASGTRSSSPLISNGQGLQKNGTKPATSSLDGGDAFSSLLSDSFTNTANNANMTMAERAAKVEREKMELLLKQQESVKVQGSPWRGLESLASSSTSTQKHSAISQEALNDDWIFDAPAVANHSQESSSKSPPVSQHHVDDDNDWGLSEFASAPTPPTSKPAAAFQVLWDLDERQRPQSPPRRQQTNSPGDFDFGDREDRLLDNDSNDEDDVLGVLSKPADSILLRHSPNNKATSRSISPPPHIIGQIVEMGFSPQQARTALAATSSGLDVQAALDLLLADNAGASPPIPERSQSRPTQHPQRLVERNGEDEVRAPRRQRATDSVPSREGELASTDIQKNIQEQADKLLSQASEIGLSVFTRANAFWSQGKEKVQRAYEERKATSGSSLNQAQNGRPKWMQDGAVEQDGGNWEDQGGFRDDHENNAPQPGPQERLPRADQPRRPSPIPPPHPPRPRISELLAEETPTVYRSPYRRGPSRAQQQRTNDYSPPSSSSMPQRVPSPIQVTHRNVVSASASSISASAKHKAVGTEMFKLGRFSEAENAYSSAIATLPDLHLLLVQLYNNRALSRSKTGDHSGTINDSSYVIKLIGVSYHPSREAKVTKDEEGASVDLADGLMKAYRRRAEAYEVKEKWDLAKKDWEVIAGTDWAASKMRNDAVVGIGRCRKMAAANSPLSANSALPPRSIPKRPPPRTTRKAATSSEALTKLRAANNAADEEEQERHELKDSVDAKIAGWKTGKEDNIRALIASLETVLWSQLGWQKVGMHELVTPAQVKVKYTKAISKLHPDKLNVNNTNVEQRMIANAVFGSLNEAWNAFKP